MVFKYVYGNGQLLVYLYTKIRQNVPLMEASPLLLCWDFSHAEHSTKLSRVLYMSLSPRI